MQEVTHHYITEELVNNFGDDIRNVSEPYGFLSIEVSREKNLDVLRFLFNHAVIKMQFVTDLCGMHEPQNKDREMVVIYHLHDLVNNVRLRIRCYMPENDPAIASATPIFSAANWMERETYDFFGINFTGHPKLKRILNVDEMNYFPMRREYPLEDQTRTDKDDRYFGR
jgi:NADH-quinone oxidoreductase subunit C